MPMNKQTFEYNEYAIIQDLDSPFYSCMIYKRSEFIAHTNYHKKIENQEEAETIIKTIIDARKKVL